MSHIRPLADLCRLYAGRRYPAYSNWSTPADVRAYRDAGVRCRLWRDVLYVHEDDHSIAGTVDLNRAGVPA